MKNSCFIVLFLLGIIPSAFAQLIGFEEEVPEAFTVSGKGEVKISSLFYNEGESSLEWDFQPDSTLDVQITGSLIVCRQQAGGLAGSLLSICRATRKIRRS